MWVLVDPGQPRLHKPGPYPGVGKQFKHIAELPHKTNNLRAKADYISKGERQLSNPKFYKEVPEDLTESINSEVSEYLDKFLQLGNLSKSLHKKLMTLKPRTAQLYLLPKIHKGILPPPGRPIVSANGCPTEKISALVDIHLRQYLVKTKSYLRDTTDFLNKLSDMDKLPDDCILGTLDVISLYTNIPNDEGCFSIYKLLNKERKLSSHEPTNSNICRLLWLVLTKNNFDFNGKHYLQIGGTAMGTRLAPTYGSIFGKRDLLAIDHIMSCGLYFRAMFQIGNNQLTCSQRLCTTMFLKFQGLFYSLFQHSAISSSFTTLCTIQAIMSNLCQNLSVSKN